MTKLKLHEYQERAIRFCLEKKKAYLAIDMGLGKTAIALKVIQRTKQKAFVLAPLRTIYSSWPEEIAKWTPELSYYILHGPGKSLAHTKDVDVVLMNYEGLKWFSQQRGNIPRRMIIYDESSMCKSHATQRFKLLRKMLLLWTDYALCLSATPAPNGLHEMWSQYFLLDQGGALEKNISAFRRKYCKAISYPGMPITLYKVDERFTKDIYKAVAPRTFRLKAEDYLDMPPITYNSIKCKLSTKLMKQYKELEKEFFLALETADIESDNKVGVSMKLRQFVQGGLYDEDKLWHIVHKIKLQALKELLDTSAGQPILCAIQFRGELTMIQDAIGSVPVIAGGTSAKQAQKYITAWNSGSLPLLLCHPASLSHGVNLQSGGHLLLWYGLTWSLEQYSQLNGRLYRQGQRNPVVIHHLVMQDTVDEAVLQALTDKAAGQDAFLSYLKQYHNKRRY